MAPQSENPTWHQDLNSASQTIKPQVFDSSTLHQRAEYIRSVKAFPHKPSVWRQYLACLNNDRRAYIRLYPDDLTHHVRMYQALQKLYELATGVIPMSAANRHSPEYTQLWLDLAAMRVEDDPDDAAATFKRMKSLRIGQALPQFWNAWADFEVRLNNHDRAARIRKMAASCLPANNSSVSSTSTPLTAPAKRVTIRPPRRVAASHSKEYSLTKNPSSATSDFFPLPQSESLTVNEEKRICFSSTRSTAVPPLQTSRGHSKESMPSFDKSLADTPSTFPRSNVPIHVPSPDLTRSDDLVVQSRSSRDANASANVTKRPPGEPVLQYKRNISDTPDGQRRMVEMHQTGSVQSSRSYSVPKSHGYRDLQAQTSNLKTYKEQQNKAINPDKHSMPASGSGHRSPRSFALGSFDSNRTATKLRELTPEFQAREQISRGEGSSRQESENGSAKHGGNGFNIYKEQSDNAAREKIAKDRAEASKRNLQNVQLDHVSERAYRDSDRYLQGSDSSSDHVGSARPSGGQKGRETGQGTLPYISTSRALQQETSTAFSACSAEGNSPLLRFLSGVDAPSLVTVNGKPYLILEMVGKGGSSKVFKVLCRDMKILALKRVKVPRGSNSSALLDSYANEIALLKKLRGAPTIIELYDSEVSREQGIIMLVMEYGDTDLAKLLLRNKVSKVDDNFRRLYWHQMLEAVHTIHEARIIHGDLKPANFLIVQGRLKLIDFGIARAIIAEDTTKIVRDSQVGTPNYMAPEALCAEEEEDEEYVDPSKRWTTLESSPKRYRVGRASDVWSLGCILYQMVYGRAPFAHIKNTFQKLRYIQDPNIEIPYKAVSNPFVLDVLRGCLQRDPNRRVSIPSLLEHPFIKSSAEMGWHQLRGTEKEAQAVKNTRSVVSNVFGFLRRQGYEKIVVNGQDIPLRKGSAQYESIVDDLVQQSAEIKGAAVDVGGNTTKIRNAAIGRQPRTPTTSGVTTSGVTIGCAAASPDRAADVAVSQNQ